MQRRKCFSTPDYIKCILNIININRSKILESINDETRFYNHLTLNSRNTLDILKRALKFVLTV